MLQPGETTNQVCDNVLARGAVKVWSQTSAGGGSLDSDPQRAMLIAGVAGWQLLPAGEAKKKTCGKQVGKEGKLYKRKIVDTCPDRTT